MKGGYALDMKASGFGLIPLAYHAEAAYADPVTDNLYLVLDENNEPTDDMLPLASTAPAANARAIYQFNGDATSNMVYRWRSKLYLLARPKSFFVVQVRSETYNNTVIRFYKQVFSAVYQVWQDILVREVAVPNDDILKLPVSTDYSRCWWEVLGTDQIQDVQIAEDIEEVD